jgi:hypothetical protein
VALRPEGRFGPRTILLSARPRTEAVVGFDALNQKIADLSREVRGRRRAETELRTQNETLEQRIEARAGEIRDVFARLYESEH